MRRFLQISLFLSSLLLAACSPVSPHRFHRTSTDFTVSFYDLIPIIDKNNALLYKTKLDLYNRHFSGLIVLKYMDDKTTHLTFVTEIGMKMFDFEITDSTFKPVYIFEPLNKPKFIKLLENDLAFIVFHKLIHHKADIYDSKEERIFRVKSDFRYYYRMDRHTGLMKNAVKKGHLLTKVKVNYAFDTASMNAEKISLRHKGLLRLRIKMTKLDKS